MATALYRRYRPEAFSEMIGQAHVTEPLMTALRTSRIGHAYLFSGPRGCGKTTSARILARCLNCAEGPTDHPCGVCPSCIELSRDGGGSLDVVEIDAASHGGVDDARDLRERAVFAPARDRFKIFIIDEAHMVTAGGFNALLKIVEEPPPHVKFIFATTEPEKVIGTIRSRTHHYPFRLIAPGALIDYVQQLGESEGVQVEPGVLALVVRSGGGSVRDTLSILDQLIAGSESNQVTLERATGLLGFTSTELIDEVVNALGSGDSAAAFRATDRIVQTGQDPRRFVEDLLERLRDLIVISATSVQGASAVFRGVPEDQLDSMFAQSQRFGHGQLSRIADTVNTTLNTMVGATAPRLHLELMVARALLSAGAPPAGAMSSGSASSGSASGMQAPGRRAASDAGTPAAASRDPQDTVASPASAGPGLPAPAAVPDLVAVPDPDAVLAAAPAAAATPPTAVPAAPAPATVDVIAAMRSARDFLKADDSDSQRPPMVPLGGHPAPGSTPAASASASSNAPGDKPQPVTEAFVAAEPGGATGTTDLTASAAIASLPTSAEDDEVSLTGEYSVSNVAALGASTEAPNDAPEGPGFEDLCDVWPDLLDELLESDREAWNAVRQVQPLALDGDVLTIGLATKSDLDAFKTSGAGPLREAIGAAIGMSIRYVPKPLPEGVRPAFAARESDDSSAEEPSLTAEPALPVEPSGTATVDVSSAQAESPPDEYPGPFEVPEMPELPESEPGYESEAGDKPEHGDKPEPGYQPEPGYESEPSYKPEPGYKPETGYESEPSYKPEAEYESVPKSERVISVTQTSPPSAAASSVAISLDAAPAVASPPPQAPVAAASSGPTQPATAPKPKRSESPGFTRYGESVVREVLGARFVEERPLPEGFER